jgi:hypothetical protein
MEMKSRYHLNMKFFVEQLELFLSYPNSQEAYSMIRMKRSASGIPGTTDLYRNRESKGI